MSSQNLIIDTKYGPVRGTSRKSLLGQEYLSFQGIPYAKAPVGELRFKVCKMDPILLGVSHSFCCHLNIRIECMMVIASNLYSRVYYHTGVTVIIDFSITMFSFVKPAKKNRFWLF